MRKKKAATQILALCVWVMERIARREKSTARVDDHADDIHRASAAYGRRYVKGRAAYDRDILLNKIKVLFNRVEDNAYFCACRRCTRAFEATGALLKKQSFFRHRSGFPVAELRFGAHRILSLV